MKKFISFILLFLMLIIPSAVKADTKSFQINKFIENAVILDNGDVNVEEEISYSFIGDYNGVYRNLAKKGASAYTISEVLIRDKNNKVTSMKNSDSSSDNTYQITDTGSECKIKLFSKSSNEIKTFILRYTIHGAAVKTNDSSELYWSFYTVENGVQVADFELNLSLKSADFDPNITKHWAYIDGKDLKDSYDTKKIHISGKSLTGVLGVRVVFQKDYLKIPITNMDNSGSPSEENNYGFNRDAGNMPVQESDTNGIAIVFFILILAVITMVILMSVLKDKEKYREAVDAYRAQSIPFDGSMLSEPPSDLPPALVELLVNEKHISASSICATLYYLSSKGYYSIEKESYEKSHLFGSEEMEDLLFRRNFEKEMPESTHLQYFIDWMAQYEKEGVFTLRYVEEEVSTSRGATEFRSMLSSAQDIVHEEAQQLGFYVAIMNKQILSNKYYDEKLRWLAYESYLLEFIKNNEEHKPISNVDEALIYASVLGIGTGGLEGLLERLKNEYQYDGYTSTSANNYALYSYMPFFITNYYLWNGIYDNVYYDNSSSSSSGFTGGDGGGFGGFSDGGGGGFSGGGGGDSGAF